MARRGTRSRSAAAISPPEGSAAGISRLIVVRESDAANRLLFFEMIYKTVQVFQHRLPGIARLLEIGVDVFDRPQEYQAQIIGSSKARTALFMLDPVTIVMFHMGSAALDDDDASDADAGDPGDSRSLPANRNCFTARVVDVLRRYTPADLWVFGINRLVRDFVNASRLQIVLKELGTKLLYRDGMFDLRDPTSAIMWSLVASFASAERDGIVERNVLGKVAQARRGEWPFGQQHVPFGYALDGKTIRPDPALAESVRKILEYMADPSMTAREFVEKAAAVGMSRPRLRNLHNDQTALVNVAIQPKDIRRSMLAWCDLFETGTYQMDLPCPTAVGDVYGGLPVWLADDGRNPTSAAKGKRMITLKYEFGTPQGGWAPPSTFEAIRQRVEDDRAFATPVTRGMRRPFGARDPYLADDGTMLLLDTGTSNGYRLRSVELELTTAHGTVNGQRTSKPRSAVRHSTTLATFSVDGMHRVVVEGVIEALSSHTGVDGRITPGGFLPPLSEHDELKRLLASRLERLRLEAQRAADNAARTDQSAARDMFVATAERAMNDVALAEAELTELYNVSPDEAGARTVISTGEIALMLSRLAKAGGPVDGPLADALQTVIPTVEVHPTTDPLRFEWRVELLLPLEDDRVLRLGPICGTVAPKSLRRGPVLRPARRPADQRLQAWAQGMTLDDLAALIDRDRNSVLKSIQSTLVAGGFTEEAARQLRHADPTHLRQLVLAASAARTPEWMSAEPRELEEVVAEITRQGVVPAGCDAGWAALALRAYHHTVPPHTPRVWKRNSPLVAAALDSVLAGRDTLEDISVAMRAIDGQWRRPREVARVIRQHNAPLRPAEPWIETWPDGIAADNRYLPIECPRCSAPMTVYLDIVEVPGGGLCERCRVHSGSASPVFPHSYFTSMEQVAVPQEDLKPAKRGIDSATAATAAERYLAGESTRDIKASLGIGNSQLYGALRSHGVAARKPYRRRRSGPT